MNFMGHFLYFDSLIALMINNSKDEIVFIPDEAKAMTKIAKVVVVYDRWRYFCYSNYQLEIELSCFYQPFLTAFLLQHLASDIAVQTTFTQQILSYIRQACLRFLEDIFDMCFLNILSLNRPNAPRPYKPDIITQWHWQVQRDGKIKYNKISKKHEKVIDLKYHWTITYYWILSYPRKIKILYRLQELLHHRYQNVTLYQNRLYASSITKEFLTSDDTMVRYKSRKTQFSIVTPPV